MTLVYDDRQKLTQQGKAGMHAFIIGVSAYPNLPLRGQPATPNSYGMKQLDSTARSAFAVYKWLLSRKDQLPVPLATVRLLLSPSDAEKPDVRVLDAAGQEIAVQTAGVDNFRIQALEWRSDAATSKDNYTFFYYSGHGIKRTGDNHVMLLDSFGADSGNPLDFGVDTSNVFYGMAPTADPPPPGLLPGRSFPNIARTQLYFIDACNAPLEATTAFEPYQPRVVFGVPGDGKDDRQAPLFIGAIPGAQAYTIRGEQTIFSDALIHCLEGKAGDFGIDTDGVARWRVTIGSLNDALTKHLAELAARRNLSQDFTLRGHTSGLSRDIPLRYLDQVPDVDVTITLVPDTDEAVRCTKLQMVDITANAPINPPLPAPLPMPLPYRFVLKAGIYRIVATIDPATPGLVGNPGQIPYQVKPPSFPAPVRLLP